MIKDKPKGIWINEFYYSFSAIKKNDQKVSDPWVYKSLTFFHDWLNNKQSFTLYTSGSTGDPKPVEISRRQMEVSASLTAEALNLKPGMNALVCLNPDYIAGTMMLVRSIMVGMNVYVIEPSANPLTNLNESLKIDFAAFVPLQLQAIFEESASGAEILNKINAIIVGGAPVNEFIKREVQKIKGTVYSTYGMTETVSHIALQQLNGADYSEYFTTLPGVIIGKDERGCLTIQSEITNNKKIITNDLVEIKSPNKFRWMGRLDNVINSGGIKIQAEQLEQEIAGIFNDLTIHNSFIISEMNDERLGKKVVLVVEGNLAYNRDELLEILRHRLDKYKAPKDIICKSAFTKTISGKIDRKQLKEELNAYE